MMMLDASCSYSQILRRHIKSLLTPKATYCLEVVGLLAEAACSLLLVDSPAVLAAGFPEEGGWMVAGGLILCKPSGGGTGKSRTKPLNHQLGDVRLKVLSMS
jgi:hypothetical protein